MACKKKYLIVKSEQFLVMKGDHKMAEITKDTTIGDILRIKPSAIPLLMEIGMHCIGCPASQAETVEEAAMVHGIDAEDLVKQMNAIPDEQ